MRNYVETCNGIRGYNSGYNFFVYLLPVFVVDFSNAFWHGKEVLEKHGS